MHPRAGRSVPSLRHMERKRPSEGEGRSRAEASSGLRLDEALQLLRAARVAELAERLRLDLADALAGDLEVLTDLFEGVVALLADAEAHPEHLLLARRQRLQDLPGLLGGSC